MKAEKNIRLFTGVRIVAAETENSVIRFAIGRGVSDGRKIRFEAPLFADCTGDGALGAASKDTTLYRQDGDAGILCDRTFIEAVISGDGSKIRSSYRDAFKSVSFTMACNKSMELGVPVKVELE